jgi:UDP-3-O-[3-hydroxymyristoyl] N-acetylglucosamine deacetylase
MLRPQQTIAQSFTLKGVGLHSGEVTTVTIHPSPADTGRYFVIDDGIIPAQCQSVASTVLSTELRKDNKTVRTVEHLLAALVGMGIDNARIETDHSELPILDGSALPWVQAIATVGIEAQDAMAQELKPITSPISVSKGDSFVMAMPNDYLRFSYGIEFDTQAIASII